MIALCLPNLVQFEIAKKVEVECKQRVNRKGDYYKINNSAITAMGGSSSSSVLIAIFYSLFYLVTSGCLA